MTNLHGDNVATQRHPKRDSIEADLSVVFAALAVWSTKTFVRTTRRYRTVQIRAIPRVTRRPPSASYTPIRADTVTTRS
jgi:hypothetical protein